MKGLNSKYVKVSGTHSKNSKTIVIWRNNFFVVFEKMYLDMSTNNIKYLDFEMRILACVNYLFVRNQCDYLQEMRILACVNYLFVRNQGDY